MDTSSEMNSEKEAQGNGGASKPVLVWDLPARILHWTLAGSFLGALATSEIHGARPLHVYFGLLCALAVVLRLAWGLVGSKHSRFPALLRSPMAAAEHLADLFSSGKPAVHPGHTPAGGWAALALWGGSLAAAASGAAVLLAGWSDDLHEGLAFSVLALVGVHVAFVVFESVRAKANLPAAMVHGKKPVDAKFKIASSRPLCAAVVVAILAGASAAYWTGLSPDGRSVTAAGQTLELHKAKGGKEGRKGRGGDDD